jgi:preprotein translocase subunit YajC
MFISEAFAQETPASSTISVPPADSAVVAPATTATAAQTSATVTPMTTTPAQEPSVIGGALPFIIMGVAFYLLLLRPQQKRIHEHNNMISAISRNDRVVTTGGLMGKVVKVDANNIIHVEIAENVIVQVVADGIASVTDKSGAPKSATKPADKADKKAKATITQPSAEVATKVEKKAKVANDN